MNTFEGKRSIGIPCSVVRGLGSRFVYKDAGNLSHGLDAAQFYFGFSLKAAEKVISRTLFKWSLLGILSVLLFATESLAQHALANFDSGGLNYALLGGKRFYSLAVVSVPKNAKLNAEVSTEDRSIIIDIPAHIVDQNKDIPLVDERFSNLRIAKSSENARLILEYESKQKPRYTVSRSDDIDMLVIEIEFPKYSAALKKVQDAASAAPELENVQLVMAPGKSLIDTNEQINTLIPKNTALDPQNEQSKKEKMALTQISPLPRKDRTKKSRGKGRSDTSKTRVSKIEEFPMSSLRSYKPGANGLPQQITSKPPTALELKVAKLFEDRKKEREIEKGTLVNGFSFTPARGNSISAVMVEVEALKKYALNIVDAETLELTIENAKLAHSRLELPVYADEKVRGYDVMRAEYREKSLVLEIKITESFKPRVYTTSGHLWISSLE